jgi:hypothetical protein
VGLVLDEPKAEDKVEEVDGIKFLVDGEVLSGLTQYLPFQVDYDERFWFGVRVRLLRKAAGCC